MKEWFVSFGTLLIPLAVIWRIEEGESSWEVYLFLIVGFLMLFWGLVITHLNERKEIIKNNVEYNRFLEQTRLLTEIRDVSKNLTDEIRQDRDERKSNSTK